VYSACGGAWGFVNSAVIWILLDADSGIVWYWSTSRRDVLSVRGQMLDGSPRRCAGIRRLLALDDRRRRLRGLRNHNVHRREAGAARTCRPPRRSPQMIPIRAAWSWRCLRLCLSVTVSARVLLSPVVRGHRADLAAAQGRKPQDIARQVAVRAKAGCESSKMAPRKTMIFPHYVLGRRQVFICHWRWPAVPNLQERIIVAVDVHRAHSSRRDFNFRRVFTFSRLHRRAIVVFVHTDRRRGRGCHRSAIWLGVPEPAHRRRRSRDLQARCNAVNIAHHCLGCVDACQCRTFGKASAESVRTACTILGVASSSLCPVTAVPMVFRGLGLYNGNGRHLAE